MKITGALILSMSIFLATVAGAATKEPPIELKMAHWASQDSKQQDIMKVGADWFQKRFPGRFKTTIYPSQTLVYAEAGFESTVKGICDIAIVVPGWTKGRFPKTEVIDLPPGIPSAVDATSAYWEFSKKFLMDEWKEVKVLGFFVQSPQGIHTKKKAIRTLKDIKGERIRVYGIGKEIMTAFGGTPVSMPMSETYESIRQGVAAGMMAPFGVLKDYRLLDVCFYHTDLAIFHSPFYIVMNLKKYNSLPPDVKKAIDDELTPYWNNEAGKIWDRYEGLAREIARKTPKHEVIILSEAEKKAWMDAATSINDSWASGLEAKGLPGKKLVEEKLKAIAKYLK